MYFLLRFQVLGVCVLLYSSDPWKAVVVVVVVVTLF